MECADFTITSPSFSLHLGIKIQATRRDVLQFSQVIADYVEKFMSLGDLLKMRDFNIPTNTISNPDTILLMDTLGSFGLRNHINFFKHMGYKTCWILSSQRKTQQQSQTLLRDHYSQIIT